MKHLENLFHHPPDIQIHPTFSFHRKCVSFLNEQNTWTQNGHGPTLFLSVWAKALQLPLVGTFLQSEDQWLPASMTHEQDLPNEPSTFKTSPICLDLYISLLPLSISHVNDLMSLWRDWNRCTCSILLETASLIGWGCRPRPNHRASPRSFAANERTKMVSVVSLSPREGGEASWHVKQWVDLVGESIRFVCRVKPDQSSWSPMLFLWRELPRRRVHSPPPALQSGLLASHEWMSGLARVLLEGDVSPWQPASSWKLSGQWLLQPPLSSPFRPGPIPLF